jgi:hypothetical protein
LGTGSHFAAENQGGTLMPTHTELDRLAAARPAFLDRTERVVDEAEESRILDQILVFAPSPTASVNTPPSVRREHSFRIVVRVISGVSAVALVIVVIVAMAGSNGHPPGVHRDHALRVTTPSSSTAPIMRLAGLRFKLPAGYKTVDSPCTASPSPIPGTPLTVIGGLTAAASADGGCIEAGVTSWALTGAVPQGVKPVQVGPYHGFLSSGPTEIVTLYVAIPVADTTHYLVLTSVGLSADQVVAIAKAGLPTALGPAQSCQTNCG